MGSSSSSPLAVLVQRGVHRLFMSLVPDEVVAGMKVEHDFFSLFCSCGSASASFSVFCLSSDYIDSSIKLLTALVLGKLLQVSRHCVVPTASGKPVQHGLDAPHCIQASSKKGPVTVCRITPWGRQLVP